MFKCIKVKEVVVNNRKFVFHKPFKVLQRRHKRNLWILDAMQDLGIFDYGTTREEAWDNFRHLISEWYDIAKEIEAEPNKNTISGGYLEFLKLFTLTEV